MITRVNTEWILALETSVTDATLLLAHEGEVVEQCSFSSERSQECDLFSTLETILAGLPADQRLSQIIIGTGPGSYNGARVGIATAQAIAQTHGCRVAGMCSFEGVPEVSENETIWAIGDARRGSYFLMPVINGRAQPPPLLLEENDFLSRLLECEGPKITFESPARLPQGIECTKTQSTARGLLKSWLARSPEDMEILLNSPAEAFYLRPPHITKSKKTLP